MQKAIRELQRGDKVDNVSEVLTVEANDKGFWLGSRLITWRDRTQDGKDWSCIAGNNQRRCRHSNGGLGCERVGEIIEGA